MKELAGTIDWAPDELKTIKKYVEDVDRRRKPFELLFGRRFPGIDEFLKEEERTEFVDAEDKKEYLKERKEAEDKKESFLARKLKLKARLARNRLQTYDEMQAKFKLLETIPGELVEGKIKIRYEQPTRHKLFTLDGKYLYYNSKYIHDHRNPKPWWYDLFLPDSLRRYHIYKKHIRVAKLYIRQSLTNLFLTLTDMNDLVIITLSSGMISPSKNVRVKLSLSMVEEMVKTIRDHLNFIKVGNLELIFRSNMSEYKTIITELDKYGICIVQISDRRISAHNGVRKRKQARK